MGFWCISTTDHHPNPDKEESFESLKLQLGSFMIWCDMNSRGERNYFAEALLKTLAHEPGKSREVRGVVYVSAPTLFGWPSDEIDDGEFAKLCVIAQLYEREMTTVLSI